MHKNKNKKLLAKDKASQTNQRPVAWGKRIFRTAAAILISFCLVSPALATDTFADWLSEERFLAECGAMERTTPQYCACANEKVFLVSVKKGLEAVRKTQAFKAQPVHDMNARLQEDPAVNDERIADICGTAEEYLFMLGTGADPVAVKKTYRRVSAEMADKIKSYGFNDISSTYMSSPQTYCYHVKLHKEESAKFQARIDMYESKHAPENTRKVVWRARTLCN